MRIISWIVVAIVIIGAGYFAMQNYSSKDVKEKVVDNKSETDGWVDYQNSEYGFSVKHPANWESQETLKPQELKALHDIVFFEREYEMVRPSLTVRIFTNDNNQSLDEWWSAWLADEDIKKEECVAEYAGDAPCLFLRDLVEREEKTTLAGKTALAVGFFRFDSEEECVFTANGKYIYATCYDGANPNDPNFEVNKKTTENIRKTFAFQEIVVETNDSVIGRWQSIDDVKSVKVFKEDGITEDVYDGQAMSNGTWEIINSAELADGSSVEGTFLKAMIDNEEYLYTVVSVNESELELTYLPRGNTLKYNRIVD